MFFSNQVNTNFVEDFGKQWEVFGNNWQFPKLPAQRGQCRFPDRSSHQRTKPRLGFAPDWSHRSHRSVGPMGRIGPISYHRTKFAVERLQHCRARLSNEEPRTKNQEPRTKNEEPRTSGLNTFASVDHLRQPEGQAKAARKLI